MKLIALDPDDLTVLAAHLQDAVATVGEITYVARDRRFVALMNRYDWAEAAANAAGPGVRRRAALRIERVQKAQVQGLDLTAKGTVVTVLTALFEPVPEADKAPAGLLTLVLAGSGAIRLHVECIEMQLEDLGPAWSAKAAPKHE